MQEELTAKEHDILKLVVKGLNNKEIANELNISISTVKSHIEKILAKLDKHNRLQAAVYAVKNDLV